LPLHLTPLSYFLSALDAAFALAKNWLQLADMAIRVNPRRLGSVLTMHRRRREAVCTRPNKVIWNLQKSPDMANLFFDEC
jgi:hypothetical protein